ncbi:MAG TPA: arginine--tRNA ligase [Solirubrobacterales bacterium]|nr:arginine--tRNA ligase [Solirubrobacterales bacterium]
MPPTDSIAELKGAVEAAARALRDGEPTQPAPTLDRPPKPDLGDYSSNAAMLLAGALGDNPRAVAERLRGELEGSLGGAAGSLDRVEVAGPGFVNLFLSDAWYRRALAGLVAAGDDLGPAPSDSPEKILVEFVSANPTGPLHVGGGRGAAYGDAVARLLAAIGHQVEREYYINDAGSQITNFAASIVARMRGEELPEAGYQGEYVVELGKTIAAEGIDPDDLQAVGARGIELMIDAVRATLSRFGVEMDTWFSERSLVDRGDVESALAKLDAGGHTYQHEGALWLRTTTFGDDKDRVLIRSDGEPTYLMPDIAYHWDKLERGFGRLIDVLGADHHGYIGRLRASIEALGADPDSFEALIMSLVHIVEDGQRAQMSKRSGDFVSLDDLIDDIGVDAVRWFMLWRSHETTVDIDLALARKQASENPVYYVQYAHARIASILRKAADEGSAVPQSLDAGQRTEPLASSEKALIKRLLEFPHEVRESANRRAPHRVCAYSTTVAADFHAFYRDCQVVGAEGEGVEASRLALCLAAKRTIAGALDLLGISAPERM